MSVIAAEISAFGQQLRHWRRQRRLSQLALALESEVSQRHVSFLESGRARPSRDMALQLAETLELPLRERNHFLAAAGFAPAYSYRGLDDADMAPVRQALELLLQHHEPYPAIVVDRHWNIVTQNTAMARVLGLLGDIDALWQRICPGGERNIIKLTLHPDGMRPLIENFAEIGAALINRCHREAVADPQLRELLDEILAYPGTPSRWQTPDFSLPNSPLLTMDMRLGTLRARLFSTITTFGTPQDVTTDELRVESIFPADEATASILRQLAAGS